VRNTEQPLTAGELSHRITIEAPAETLAPTATTLETSVPAAITVLSPQFQAREAYAHGGLTGQLFYMVSVRYRTDLKSSYVFQEECCTQRRFQIQSVIPSDRRDAIDMMCVTAG
jgi:head-tail adaptor